MENGRAGCRINLNRKGNQNCRHCGCMRRAKDLLPLAGRADIVWLGSWSLSNYDVPRRRVRSEHHEIIVVMEHTDRAHPKAAETEDESESLSHRHV